MAYMSSIVTAYVTKRTHFHTQRQTAISTIGRRALTSCINIVGTCKLSIHFTCCYSKEALLQAAHVHCRD